MTVSSKIPDLHCDSRLADSQELRERHFQAERLLNLWSWKTGLPPGFPLLASLIGGTGTGKSTLFNSLAGARISEVGMRRPCTLKAVILVHEDWAPDIAASPLTRDESGHGLSVGDTNFRIEVHGRPELAGLILVDTPDFDSVEPSNRIIADTFFVISDLVLFVTSQEKYGDLTGLQMRERAQSWGKKSIFIINKVAADAAFDDFCRTVNPGRQGARVPIRVERLDSPADLIPGLRDGAQFAELFAVGRPGPDLEQIRLQELDRLRRQAASGLENLEKTLNDRIQRISTVNLQIDLILNSTQNGMEAQLDAILTKDLEIRIQDRLRALLRKYDILFVPRMIVRTAANRVVQFALSRLRYGWGDSKVEDEEKEFRMEDFRNTWSSVRLGPLESAVARLNRKTAEVLSSDAALDDLRRVALNDVKRLDPKEIRSLFDDAFLSMEGLLEKEFEGFRRGFSRWDEMKLYGSYTFWALLLVTAEVAMGGGFTLLDALLGGVIVPFIPKWLLNLKVLDLLRDIGEKVDRQYRDNLRRILHKQAQAYKSEFSGLVSGVETLNHIRMIRKNLAGRP